MGLEDTIAEAIIMGMDELAGNPRRAVAAAMDCQSAAQWIKQETTKLALIGGAEMVVPGLHAFTIPTGISYLLHKMGYISWGIGALKGAFVIETEAYSDLRNILALWANEGHFDAAVIEHLALSLDALTWTLGADGQARMPGLLGSSADATTVRTFHIMQRLAENFVAGDERGYAVMAAMRGEAAAGALAGHGEAACPAFELRSHADQTAGAQGQPPPGLQTGLADWRARPRPHDCRLSARGWRHRQRLDERADHEQHGRSRREVLRPPPAPGAPAGSRR